MQEVPAWRGPAPRLAGGDAAFDKLAALCYIDGDGNADHLRITIGIRSELSDVSDRVWL